jgi:hypothetical protein
VLVLYNMDGCPSSTQRPAVGDLSAESVAYQYDVTTGLPITSDSSYNNRSISYAGRIDYDAFGRFSQLVLYPGLHNGIGKRVYQPTGTNW